MSKIIIVGAGPAGLWAAHRLSKKHKVTILEKRSFVGGSGLHSDGKLNFHPQIGGDLTEFMTPEKAWALNKEIKDHFTELGVDLAHTDDEALRKLETKASRAGIKFVKIDQNHIGSDYLPDVMARMKKQLEDQGVEIKLKTEAIDLEVEDGRVKTVISSIDKYPTDAVLLSREDRESVANRPDEQT